jgi:O-antigen/teichoic acid export membrane protein
MTAGPARSTAALGVHSLVSRLIIYSSGFVASVLVARGLGPAGNGLYAVAMTAGTMAALIGSVGFEQAQAKAWSRAEHSRAALYGAAIRVAATTGIACALLVLAAWAAGRHSVFDGLGLLALAIVAAVVPWRVLLTLVRGLLIVGGELERSNLALVVGDLVRTSAIVALALTGALSVEAVLATIWLTVLVSLALHMSAAGRPLRPPAGLLRGQLVAGAQLSPYFVFLFLNQRLDLLLLAALADARSVGIYAVAVIFAELVWFVSDAINAGARVRQWSADPGDALAAGASAARMSLLLALLAIPPLAIVAPPAIGVLFGHEFTGASDALWALLPAAAAMAWWRALSAGLVRFARARTVSLVAFAAVATNVALNAWLIPRHGIAGAALASLGSYALGAVLAAATVARGRLAVRELLPGAGDVRRLATVVADLARTARRA